ncbi:ribosomal protein bL25 (Ctc-form) [Novosphingobium sediminicola]|uniref:Large ribosomal subunit protein bL25 n=1 Tax=Novosphingobium sediminicola TaxID=563162 RepID=A0A7W6CJ98_9SPHN|nr:ribosomal protein bL25 (Ctc-form) [Novosphingobium sediminicola]
MSNTLTLPAETRAKTGKGASRTLRREGRVPAVIYGGNAEPISIHVEAKELTRQLNTGTFFDSVIELTVDGQTIKTIAKDVALHPVSDRAEHVDFLRA